MTGYWTRRQAMGGLAAGVAAATLRPAKPRAATRELVWSTWETNGKPVYVEAFTKQTGTAIRQAYLSDEDAQFVGLRSGAATDWDVVNPSMNGVGRYIKAKVLQPLDMARLPNAGAMYPAFSGNGRIKGDDGQTYVSPYLWGLNPIVYRADSYADEPTYATLFDSKYKGRLAMRDYPLESIGVAGLFVGVPRDRLFAMDDKELAEAKKALIAQKPLLRTYWQSIGDLTNLFATNEVTCAFSWRTPFDELRAKLPMGMAKPKAGVFGWCDCFAIPATLPAEKLDAAYAFGNYLLGPDYAYDVGIGSNYASTTSVVRDRLNHAQQAAMFIDDLEVMNSFMWPVAPPNYAQWLRLWNEVKAA